MSLDSVLTNALRAAGVCGPFSIVGLQTEDDGRYLTRITFSTMPLKLVNTSALSKIIQQPCEWDGDKVVIG